MSAALAVVKMRMEAGQYPTVPEFVALLQVTDTPPAEVRWRSEAYASGLPAAPSGEQRLLDALRGYTRA